MAEDKFNLQMDIPQKLLEDIEFIGKQEDRTRNGQIIKLLREGVNRYNNDPNKRELRV